MNALRLAARIASANREDRRLALEALVCLTWARFLILLPFPAIRTGSGQAMQETSADGRRFGDMPERIAAAVSRAGRLTPLDTRCLVRAIAAMKMLERRRMDSTLYLGTAKDRDGRMIAHAWLRCGGSYVTGAEEKKGFTVVGMFAKRFHSEEQEGSR